MDFVPEKPHYLTKLAIENASAVLQNTSLKTQGAEKLIHNSKNPFEIAKKLIMATSLNCDDDNDTLSLMAFTYMFSVLYQLASRKIGRNLASASNFFAFLNDRI